VKATALAVLATACSATDPEPAWSTVFDELDRVALSVWSMRADDVYVVGGGLGIPDSTSLALHWDGDQWRDLAPEEDRTLWWVTGAPGAATDVWMVGEDAVVLRWDGDTFASIASPVDTTLFGAWAAASDDVWFVGGAPGAGEVPENDVVLHWNGTALVRDETVPARGVALLKVWGTHRDDLWVVGERGTLWHRTARGWEDHSRPTASTLFSVHGCGTDDVYAVGGTQVLHFDGTAWTNVGPPIFATAIGVACGATGALISGSGGLKLRWDRATDTWHDEQLVEPWVTDFHAASIDAGGGAWAVGGNFNEPSDTGPRIGVVAYFGANPPRGETP
jgi:hypothetical protein